MSNIRPVALVIFRKNDKILVVQGRDPATKKIFYRPLGGTIEFKEKGEEALRREIKEELGAEIKEIKYLGMIENIFTYNNQAGHEIDLIYKAKFVDPKFYTQTEIKVKEGKEEQKAYWLPIKKFEKKELILYPAGIIKFVSKAQG